MNTHHSVMEAILRGTEFWSALAPSPCFSRHVLSRKRVRRVHERGLRSMSEATRQNFPPPYVPKSLHRRRGPRFGLSWRHPAVFSPMTRPKKAFPEGAGEPDRVSVYRPKLVPAKHVLEKMAPAFPAILRADKAYLSPPWLACSMSQADPTGLNPQICSRPHPHPFPCPQPNDGVLRLPHPTLPSACCQH